MNMKILVQTLTQIPDPQLLQQLSQSIQAHKKLLLPSPIPFYKMLSTLFSTSNKAMIVQAVALYKLSFTMLLKTELEQSWNETSQAIVRMLGEEDKQVRDLAKDLLLDIVEVTNNAVIVLEKLYYQGLEDESVLVFIMSSKCIYTVMELYPTILYNKTSIRVVKLVIEKMIAMAMSSHHIEMQKAAMQFLQKLFYLKIEKLDEVLILLNPQVLEYLEKLWAKNKEKMLERDKEEDEAQLKIMMDIKYEHMPLINGKFFGIYEPYVLKNIFNPETQASKLMAIEHFRNIFEEQFEHLHRYLNVIYKVVIKFLDDYYNMLMILKKIIFSPGISNMVNLTILPQILIPRLATENVPYRRELRLTLQKLNFEIPNQSLKAYEEQIRKQGNSWIAKFQIICLCEHWIDHHMENSYPPTLSGVLEILCKNMGCSQVKVRDKAVSLMLAILDRYPGYRENLEDYFSQDRINEIEDAIEQRKNKARGNSVSQEAEEIFIKEYSEERERFLQFQKQQKQYKK